MPDKDYHKTALETLARSQTGQLFRLRVNGTSMFPILQEGETILVQTISGDELSPGDLVSVQQKDEVITHRLISMEKGQWVFMGDNLYYADRPMPQASILGRVVAIELRGKQVQLETRIWLISSHFLARMGRQMIGTRNGEWTVTLLKLISLSSRWLTRILI